MAEEAQHGTVPAPIGFLASLEALLTEGIGEVLLSSLQCPPPQLYGFMLLLSPMTSRSSISEVLGRARNNCVMSILVVLSKYIHPTNSLPSGFLMTHQTLPRSICLLPNWNL
ncbi:UNVERIFIED_CONTAM: hypothetical protein K2H54_033015 [Gekko kuhli]